MSSPKKNDSLSPIRFRSLAARKIPTPIGVYVLCDLDQVPIYVGLSRDGIRQRVRRHITSARSDVIANRMIDVWEVAFVWAWPCKDKSQLGPLEAHLFHEYHAKSRLMNGSIPAKPAKLDFPIPERIVVQLMSDDEIESRKRAPLRLTRQAQHFSNLLDQFLNVKDSEKLYLALVAHFERLTRYFGKLKGTQTEDDAPEDE